MRPLLACCCLLLALACTVSGCGVTMPRHPSKPASFPKHDRFYAGVAEVDITPPPGLSLYGHGPESRIAAGTLLRLRCQIFVIGGPDGRAGHDAVALVVCDLSQPSLLLQRRVAQLVRAATVPLGADRIVLMATHTHAGPGHIFGSSQNLSGPMSSRLFGFDDDVVTFLAEKIAGGIASAYRTMKPARVAWSYAQVYGLSRNRSMQPYLRNDEDHDELPDDSHYSRHGQQRRLSRAELAIDPLLSVLRIDEESIDEEAGVTHVPMGVFAVFGVHPSVVPNDNELYHGDVFGYATRIVRNGLERHGHDDVVVGIANGVEGDVAPAVDYQGPLEAKRLGRRLARRVRGAWDRTRFEQVPQWLRVAYRELRFDRAPTKAGRLCRRPFLGASATGGASDNPTSLRFIGRLNQGVRLRDPIPCHDYKVPVQPLGGTNTAGVQFPRWAPITQLHIAGALLVTVPAEVTTMTGRRLRRELGQVIDALPSAEQPTEITVAGLANEYMQYVATEEEYALQWYEGASTLYGPHTARMLREQHRRLARCLYHAADCDKDHHRPASMVGEVAYSPSPEIERLEPEPGPAYTVRDLRELGAPRLVITRDGRIGFEVQWRGLRLGQGRANDGPQQRVRILARPDGRQVEDDDGIELETRFVHGSDRDRWCAVWTPRLRGPRCGQRYAFEVRAEGSAAVESRVFELRCDVQPSQAAAPCRGER